MWNFKSKKFYINLYIIIPVIYAGIAVLGVIIAYQLTTVSSQSSLQILINEYTVAAAIGCLSFLASLIILRLILKPLVDFVEKTKKMPIFSTIKEENRETLTDEFSSINQVFDSVADILSQVEARELFPQILGSSTAMRNVFTQIIKVAPTDSTVLITGESGTGKELVASGIYEHSERRGKPFVTINCVAIPEGLMESELFGHEKGAFTGATARKIGKFEKANGGTVFLDEIGDMPISTQAKLLRALQEKEFERVGGNVPISVDVRFIAATNKDLSAMIREGTFREDLYFRLNVFSIHLPPLRERREEISVLSSSFLEDSPKPAKLSASALQVLIGYNWPGNVRELKNVLERASILAQDGIVDVKHLPETIRQDTGKVASALKDDLPLDERMNLMEREMIIGALRKTNGIQVKAANLLGINQRSLWHRIKKHNIDVNIFKKLQ